MFPGFRLAMRRTVGIRTDRSRFCCPKCVATVSMVQSRTRRLHTSASCRVTRSIWPDITVPNMPIPDFVFKDFKQFGNKPALINGITGQTYTFPEVQDSVWRIASGLARLGVKPGDTFLVVSENSIEYLLMFHAVLWVGGTVTMCNPHYLMGDIARQAADASAKYIFTSHLFLHKSQEVSKALKGQIKMVITVGNEPGCLSLSTLLSDDGTAFPKHVPTDPRNDVALLPFSSGTTGLPKGVMLTHYSEIANTLQSDVPSLSFERENTIQLGLLPFYHIYAFIVYFMCGLSWGQTTVVIPGFDPKLFLETIQKYKVTMSHVVPPIVMFLNKHPMTANYDLTSLNRIVCAAAPLGKDMVNELHEKRPYCTVGQAYGMTETGPAVTVNPVDFCSTKPASSGLALPSTLLKVIGSNGDKCKAGERGELCVKGPQLMKGYLNNPTATANMIDEEGWLHTGDIGYLDGEGHLYIVDRVKELIKYKGLQVPPAELEAIICTHKAVSDAAVIGIPDDEAGELPRAYVSLKAGASIAPEEIEQYVAGKVVSYKKLRGGVAFLNQIPRSPSGKILRRELKEAPVVKSAHIASS